MIYVTNIFDYNTTFPSVFSMKKPKDKMKIVINNLFLKNTMKMVS